MFKVGYLILMFSSIHVSLCMFSRLPLSMFYMFFIFSRLHVFFYVLKVTCLCSLGYISLSMFSRLQGYMSLCFLCFSRLHVSLYDLQVTCLSMFFMFLYVLQVTSLHVLQVTCLYVLQVTGLYVLQVTGLCPCSLYFSMLSRLHVPLCSLGYMSFYVLQITFSMFSSLHVSLYVLQITCLSLCPVGNISLYVLYVMFLSMVSMLYVFLYVETQPLGNMSR